jgi:hypothetical protein
MPNRRNSPSVSGLDEVLRQNINCHGPRRATKPCRLLVLSYHWVSKRPTMDILTIRAHGAGPCARLKTSAQS